VLRKCPDIERAFDIVLEPIEKPWKFYELETKDSSHEDVSMENDVDGMRKVERRVISNDEITYSMSLKQIDEQVLHLISEIFFETIRGVQK
jgi:hypothetical protein